MHQLYKQGKIRAIGVSNYSLEQINLFQQAAPLHTAQPPYNLFERSVERDVLPYCRTHRISTLTYGSLCRGLLSGKMKPGHRISRRRCPQDRSQISAASLCAVSESRRAARPLCARELRQTCPRAGPPLGLRPALRHRGALGGAPSQPAEADCGCHWLETGYGCVESYQ